MKIIKLLLLICSIVFNKVIAQENTANDPGLLLPEGPYLGQNPPGPRPELFAPGVVNTDSFREIEGMFGSDIQTFFFVRREGEDKPHNLMVIEYKNHKWQQSMVLQGESEPSISPDGNTIYIKKGVIKRTKEGWSELKSLCEPFESIDIMRLSASSSGTFYFDTYSKNLDIPIRYSHFKDGKYQPPKSLGPQFAEGRYNAHPFIAPDESYIIWDSIRDGGYGASDLYISYRKNDGSWGPAINMGDKINTANKENYPSVSPDGKYLLFDRRTVGNNEVGIYWVDAQMIKTLNPNHQ